MDIVSSALTVFLYIALHWAALVANANLLMRTVFVGPGLWWVSVVHGLLALLTSLNCTWQKEDIAVQK